jgi:hypothetical protein
MVRRLQYLDTPALFVVEHFNYGVSGAIEQKFYGRNTNHVLFVRYLTR